MLVEWKIKIRDPSDDDAFLALFNFFIVFLALLQICSTFVALYLIISIFFYSIKLENIQLEFVSRIQQFLHI